MHKTARPTAVLSRILAKRASVVTEVGKAVKGGTKAVGDWARGSKGFHDVTTGMVSGAKPGLRQIVNANPLVSGALATLAGGAAAGSAVGSGRKVLQQHKDNKAADAAVAAADKANAERVAAAKVEAAKPTGLQTFTDTATSPSKWSWKDGDTAHNLGTAAGIGGTGLAAAGLGTLLYKYLKGDDIEGDDNEYQG